MDNVQPGQSIGPYRIIQQVGQGGMAAVYKAYQPAMERYVALKILPRQLAESPEFAGRFQQEARTIAHLEHAHILPVHDYGSADGYTYLAMRYIEAGTLADRLEAGPPSDAECDRWFSQLADALDYAHAQGVIHRDLKPSNALLDSRGNLFLTDFGIAKLLEADKRFTGSGMMIGTPAYMSPEQGMGLPVDQRTDIYSLGIMLYEMVTGRVPFDAETPIAIVLKQINDPLPLPSSLNPKVTPAMEQVLLKALAKDPQARYATAGQFNAAWMAARRPTVSGATSVGQPPPRSGIAAGAAAAGSIPLAAGAAARRWPGGLALLAAGAVLLAAVVVCGGVLAAVALSPRLNAPRPTPAATGSLAAGGPATPGPGATAAVTPAPAGQPFTGQWRSWSEANAVAALALFKGELVSGGPGGLTRWNLSSGAVAGRLTTGNGLPDPYVNVLLADEPAGRLWIGTNQGVVAYDGQATHVYDLNSGLDSNVVTALALTQRGLVAGTSSSDVDGSGLNLFANDRWQPVAGYPSAGDTSAAPDQLSTDVNAILEDSHGVWWVATSNGLGRYDGQAWKRYSTSDGLPDNYVTALLEVDGALWAGTRSGVAHLDGDSFVSLPEAQGRSALGMFLAPSGDLWLTGDGILRRPAGGGTWQGYDSSQFPANTISGGLPTTGSVTYFGSDSGVLRFDGKTFDLWAVPNTPSEAQYQHILTGPSKGTLWFVPAYSSYSDFVSTADGTWVRAPDLPCDSCVPLAWGPDGRLWAGSGDGMWAITSSQATHITSTAGLPAGAAYAVAFARDGSTWIGTEAGAALYKGSGVTAVYSSTNAGLHDDTVYHLLAAADGSLWVATEEDLSRRTPDGRWVQYGAGLPFQSDVTVTGLAQDATGAVWVTTEGEGVYRFADNAWAQFRPGVNGVKLPSSNVNCVTPASDGSLWFGTDGGAARFAGDGDWQAFTVADGLVDGAVNDIFVDGSGGVWFATDGGVSELKP